MRGLLGRLSLDPVLNLNLPLLACQHEASCRYERRDADAFIKFSSVHAHAPAWGGDYAARLLSMNELNNAVTVSALFAAAAASLTWRDRQSFHNKKSPTKSEQLIDTLNHFYTSAFTHSFRQHRRRGLSVYFLIYPDKLGLS